MPPWGQNADPNAAAAAETFDADPAPLVPATPSRAGVAEQVRKVIHPDGRLEILDQDADVPEGATLLPYTGTP